MLKMPPNKKRSVDDILDDDDSMATISRLELENTKLKEEIETLKAKIAAYEEEEESDDDDDDEESVCDGTSWSKRYHLLKAYKQQHGHCNVPQKDKNGAALPLGTWVRDQRVLYRKKTLDPNRKVRVDDGTKRKDFVDVDNLLFTNLLLPLTGQAGKTWLELGEELPPSKNLGGYVPRTGQVQVHVWTLQRSNQ
jgi:hypothetical protein